MKIVIVDEMTGIHVYDSWMKLKKDHSFKKDEFTQLHGDYILNTTGDTFEISKDIKTLERVASERVFSKKSLSGIDILLIITFIFSILTYFGMNSIPGDVINIYETLKEGAK